MHTMNPISTVSAKTRLASRGLAASAALLLSAAALWSQRTAVAEPVPVALQCAPGVATGDASVPSATSVFAGRHSTAALVEEEVATF